MNWNEYLELSEKTLSREFHCEEKDELLLHATMGILTEIEELLDNYILPEKRDVVLDPVNILEEVGDVTWYLAIIGRIYNIEFPPYQSMQKSDPLGLIVTITKNTLKLLDMMKKKLYYNKPINDSLFIQHTQVIMVLIMEYMTYYNINIEDSFDINISKLKKRYGEKFTSERAINRDLEAERNILEGK